MRQQAVEKSCNDQAVCKTCHIDGACRWPLYCLSWFLPWSKRACRAVQKPMLYFASEFGQVAGELKMMAEIKERGPIACGVAVPSSLLNYNGGIYNHTGLSQAIRHVVSVVGWGEDRSGGKYWYVPRTCWFGSFVCRLSWLFCRII